MTRESLENIKSRKGYLRVQHTARAVANRLPGCAGSVFQEFIARATMRDSEVTYGLLMHQLGGCEKTHRRACKVLESLELITWNGAAFVLTQNWDKIVDKIVPTLATKLSKNRHSKLLQTHLP